ncbi:hypothetical protein [Streptomyces sp. NPDC002156]
MKSARPTAPANTARHTCASTATVRIECLPDALAIPADDDGRAAPDDAPAPAPAHLAFAVAGTGNTWIGRHG